MLARGSNIYLLFAWISIESIAIGFDRSEVTSNSMLYPLMKATCLRNHLKFFFSKRSRVWFYVKSGQISRKKKILKGRGREGKELFVRLFVRARCKLHNLLDKTKIFFKCMN